ncbi:MAG TPA: hypothetical protein VGG74_00270 [Kofleriaceae bacterium]
MKRVVLSMAAACSSTPPAPPQHALGMNDLSILLPLPSDTNVPVLSQVDPLVQSQWFQSLVIAPGDLGPRSNTGFTYDQFQVVAMRWDVCDRSIVGQCPANVDGRLRLIVQPVQNINGTIQTIDVASHLFYPIPAAELPDVVDQLRDLAALADTPADAPLEVSPVGSNAAYLAQLKSLVLAYARPDNLVRVTVIGQLAGATPFEWNMRELDASGSIFTQTTIPQIGLIQQTAQLADGDITYQTGPGDLVDEPAGLALGLQGANWDGAGSANERLAIDALAQVMNPTLHDAVDTQCLACHVATYLSTYRSGELMMDPTTSPSWYRSQHNLDVGMLGNDDPRQIRNFGYVGTTPIASQRVANDTAHALDDVDRLFPARE